MMKLLLFVLCLISHLNIAYAEDIATYVPEKTSNLITCNDKLFRHECFDMEVLPDGTKYYGEYRDNKRNGFGVLVFGSNETFEGTFKDGWRVNGKQAVKNGDNYIGDFFQGKYHGSGEAIFTDGRIYRGDFRFGRFSGKGMMIYPNGDVYTGDFQNDAFNGEGMYRFKNNETYQGQFKSGKYDGFGILEFANGDETQGIFIENKCVSGATNFADGRIYRGGYVDGNFEGRGILQFSNGDVYKGDFKRGRFSQKGVYKFKNGETHIGKYENGVASGFGEYHYLDGRTYVGDFKAGRSTGWGIEFIASQIISRQGVWDNGELINAAVVDPKTFPSRYGLKTKIEIESLNATVIEAFRSLRENEIFVSIEKAIYRKNSLNGSLSYWGEIDTGDAIGQLVKIRDSLINDEIKESKIIIIEDKINDLKMKPFDELHFLGSKFVKDYPSGHYFHSIGMTYSFMHSLWKDPAKVAKYSKELLNENDIQAVAMVEYNDGNFEVNQCKQRAKALSMYLIGSGLEKDFNILRQIAERVNYGLDILIPCIDLDENTKKILFVSIEPFLAYGNNPDKSLEILNEIDRISAKPLTEKWELKLKRGRILRAAGRLRDAELEYTEALELAKRSGLSDHIGFEALASLYIDMKEFDKAENLLITRISLSNVDGSDNWYKCEQLGLLARSYEHQAMFDNAIAIRKVCLSLVDVERKRMVSASMLEDKVFIANAIYGEFYEELATTLINMGRLPEAQQVLDMLKEEEQFEYVRRSNDAEPRKTRVGQTPRERVWLTRYNQITDRLGTLGAKLRELDERAKFGLTRSQQRRHKLLKADLVVAQSAFGRFVGEMRKDFAAKGVARAIEMSETSEQAAKEIQSLIRSLGDGVALLQYYITDEQVGMLLTTPGVQIARSFKIGRKELNRQISEFRFTLRDPKSDPLPAAKALYKVLLGPVESDLNQVGAKTVMLSLDGALRYLPFGTLNDGERYVAQRWNLPIYTSLVRERLRSPPSAKWRAAGFGVTRAFGQFAALPAVRVEIASVVKTAGNSGVVPGEIFLDEEFSAQRLKDMGQQKVELLHVASHFQFSPGTEANSFLLLGDGQQLTLGDLRKRNFRFDNVDLLTLSACDTGLGGGRDEKGKEIEGFGVIAQQQGANAVLATLWPVSDQSTAILMADMYRRRQTQGLSKIDALRQAQVALMQQPVYSHPFYWAPFILLGNWK